MKKLGLLKLFVVPLCLGLILALTACGGQAVVKEDTNSQENAVTENAPANKKIVIGVPVYTMEHPYYIELMAAVKAEADKQDVTLLSDDSNYDPVKQIAIIENMVTQGADVLIVAAIDPVGIVPTVQQAMEKGVKIIIEANMLYDNNKNALGETFVGIDNFAAGKLGGEEAGKAYAEMYPGIPAKIAIISYPLEQACIDRENGFVEGFKKFVPDAVVMASQNGEAVRDKAMSVMENILTANPGINVVFGINDDSALGALAAMESRGITKNAMVVGFDGTADAKSAILKGGIFFGDVVQDATMIGTQAVQAAVKAVKGESLPPITEIPASFITIADLK